MLEEFSRRGQATSVREWAGNVSGFLTTLKKMLSVHSLHRPTEFFQHFKFCSRLQIISGFQRSFISAPGIFSGIKNTPDKISSIVQCANFTNQPAFAVSLLSHCVI